MNIHFINAEFGVTCMTHPNNYVDINSLSLNKRSSPRVWNDDEYDSNEIKRIKQVLRSGEIPSQEKLVAMLIDAIEDRSDWVSIFHVQKEALQGFVGEEVTTSWCLAEVAIAIARNAYLDSEDFLNKTGGYSA